MSNFKNLQNLSEWEWEKRTIQKQNSEFRRTFSRKSLDLGFEIPDLPQADQDSIFERIKTDPDFNDTDGQFSFQGRRVFWSIHWYDPTETHEIEANGNPCFARPVMRIRFEGEQEPGCLARQSMEPEPKQ